MQKARPASTLQPSRPVGYAVRMLRRALFALAALATLVAFIFLARAWAPDRPVDDLKARWAPAPSQFLDVDGLVVHYRDVGPREDPTPLVLLHGTSASLHTWEGWVARLSPSRRVVTLDLPGFGLTGAPADGDLSIPHTLKTLHALLAKLGVSQCIVAGNSYGGRIAWEYALVHRDEVKGLVLVDAAGYPLQSKSVPLGFRIARMSSLRVITEKLLPRSVIEKSVRNVYGDPSLVTPELVDRYYELTLREGNRAALVKRFEQVPLIGDTAQLKTLTTPTLILWGAKDELIPPENARRFADDLPNDTLVMFDALGHVPQEEAPDVSVAALQRWLAAQ